MDAKQVVLQLRTLASVAENRPSIIKDRTCLSGIVRFMEHKDQDVVLMALQVIHYLAMSKELRKDLSGHPNLVATVKRVMMDITATSNTKRLASEIYASLQGFNVPTTPSRFSLNGFGSSSTGLSMMNTKNSSAVVTTHIVYVSSLTNEANRNLVEKKLLTVKGIISFLLDIHTHEATIRTSLPSKDLLSNLKLAGITGVSLANEKNKENEPDYLPDEEPSNAKPSSSSWFSSIVSWGTEEPVKPVTSTSRISNLFCSVGEALHLY